MENQNGEWAPSGQGTREKPCVICPWTPMRHCCIPPIEDEDDGIRR